MFGCTFQTIMTCECMHREIGDMANNRNTIKLWFKAFIPRDLEGASSVPGSGLHSGKTMLLTPGPINACFLTDQRSFSPDIDAHARMHSEIEIDLHTAKILNEVHKCYETIEVDCETGREKCRKSADTSNMKFRDFHVSDASLNSGTPQIVFQEPVVSGSNPVSLAGSPAPCHFASGENFCVV